MISGAGGTPGPHGSWSWVLVWAACGRSPQPAGWVLRKAYDVRSAAKEEVESLGAEFIQVDGAIEDRKAVDMPWSRAQNTWIA